MHGTDAAQRGHPPTQLRGNIGIRYTCIFLSNHCQWLNIKALFHPTGDNVVECPHCTLVLCRFSYERGLWGTEKLSLGAYELIMAFLLWPSFETQLSGNHRRIFSLPNLDNWQARLSSLGPSWQSRVRAKFAPHTVPPEAGISPCLMESLVQRLHRPPRLHTQA